MVSPEYENQENVFLDECVDVSAVFRDDLKSLEERARYYIEALKWTEKWEAIAQATLAMRHIEDARMRYGKVIQYLWDGVSKFDKPLENKECISEGCKFVTANESWKCSLHED